MVRRLVEAMEKVQKDHAANCRICNNSDGRWASWRLRSVTWRRKTWVCAFAGGTDKGELLSCSLVSMTYCPRQRKCLAWMYLHQSWQSPDHRSEVGRRSTADVDACEQRGMVTSPLVLHAIMDMIPFKTHEPARARTHLYASPSHSSPDSEFPEIDYL